MIGVFITRGIRRQTEINNRHVHTQRHTGRRQPYASQKRPQKKATLPTLSQISSLQNYEKINVC